MSEGHILVQRENRTGDLVEGEGGQIAGVESRRIAGDNGGSFVTKVAPEMLCGFQRYIAVLTQIRTGDQEGSVVKGLDAHGGYDDIHIAHTNTDRIAQCRGKPEEVGGNETEKTVAEGNDPGVFQHQRLTEDLFVSAAQLEGYDIAGTMLP